MKNLTQRSQRPTGVKFASPFIITGLIFLSMGCRSVKNGKDATEASLTNIEVIEGIKEALSISIQNSVDSTSGADGFSKNDSIRLPFPPEAMKVREKAMEWGFQSQVEKFETSLNQAAAEATKKAGPIFGDAIANMTIADGFAILNGGDGAATAFLRKNTEAQLAAALYPVVDAAIKKVEVTKYWNPIINKFNKVMTIAGKDTAEGSSVAKVDPDLSTYVTKLTIDGLFKMMEKEENKIRKSPTARVSKRLQRVFGSV